MNLKMGVIKLTGFIGLGVDVNGGFCEHGNEPSGYTKG